jgi:hypothetical protein
MVDADFTIKFRKQGTREKIFVLETQIQFAGKRLSAKEAAVKRK